MSEPESTGGADGRVGARGPGEKSAAVAGDGPGVAPARSATTLEDELARLDQALLDLSVASATSVSLIHCPSSSAEEGLVRELAQRARDRKFVTAHLSLRESSPASPDDLLRAALVALVPPSDGRPCGLIWLLDEYEERHGRKSAERFAESAAREGAQGDLTALCRAYLSTEDPEATSELRAYEAWLDGVEPARKHLNHDVRRALNRRTAQTVLGELSRVLRAIDHRGLVLFLSAGDAIASRTDRQREKAYTVLRELVDNFDTGAGAVATSIILTGTDRLFHGSHSLQSLPPLLMRLQIPSDAEPPPPHRSWTTLIRDPYEFVHRKVTAAPERRAAALRTLIRVSEGLPPIESVTAMSVGQDRIDRTIDKLFEHMGMAGSVFSSLVGEYGSGKTHIMLHLAERALENNHPVFWLNLERMNLDLGNPSRHLSRLLEHSTLPIRGRPSARERASVWTRSPAKLRQLEIALWEIAESPGQESFAALKALRIGDHAKDRGHAWENFLAATDLESRRSSSGYRRDAYARMLLWIELLKRLEGCEGAVVLIDEAENLYTTGAPWSVRRTALRSLSFYCSGALPASCVVMAMTPSAYLELGKETKQLLDEVDEMASTLDLEDVAVFRSRIHRLAPEQVPALTHAQRLELIEKVRRTHQSVRGKIEFDDWESHAKTLARNQTSPRLLIRTVVDELESAWWGQT